MLAMKMRMAEKTTRLSNERPELASRIAVIQNQGPCRAREDSDEDEFGVHQ